MTLATRMLSNASRVTNKKQLINREFSLLTLVVSLSEKKMSLSSNSEEEISPYSSEVLENVNKHVKDVLNRETSRVRKEIKALDRQQRQARACSFLRINPTVFFLPSAILPCPRTHFYSNMAKFLSIY